MRLWETWRVVLLLLVGIWLFPSLSCAQEITGVTDEDYFLAVAAFRDENRRSLEPIMQRLTKGSCSLSQFRCLHLRIIEAETQFGRSPLSSAERIVSEVEQSSSGIIDPEEQQHLAVLVEIVRTTGFGARDNTVAAIEKWLRLANEFSVASEAPRIQGELAYAYFRNGKTDLAAKHYQLEVDSASTAEQEAYILHGMIGIGLCYKRRGEYAQAIDFLNKVVARIEAGNPNCHRRKLGFIHGHLGAIHKQLGRYDAALKHYELARQVKLLSGEATTTTAYLDHIASIYRLQGRHEEALRMLKEDFLPHTRNAAGHNMAYREIALNLAALEKFEPALVAIDKAIEIRIKKQDFSHIGEYLADKGGFLMKLGRAGDAFETYRKGWVIGSEQQDVESQWKNLYGIFHAQVALDHPVLAIWYGKQAVNTLQAMRSGNTGLDSDSQNSFLQKNESAYKALADLLFSQGRLTEGQQVLMMLKEAEYFNFIQRSSDNDPRKTRASFDGKEQLWADRYEKINKQLVAMSLEHESLKAKAGLSEQRRKDEIKANLDVARQAFDVFLIDIKREFTQSVSAKRTTDDLLVEFGSKNLNNLRVLKNTLLELGHGAVILNYLMTDKRLWILLTTPTIQLKREAAISETNLNLQIGKFREAIAQRDPKVKEMGKVLYDLIIAPVADDLKQANAQTLMLSLDGGLRYLPMAALYDGEKFLMERYRLSIYTSAATAQLNVPPKTDWSLAGFGLTQAVSLKNGRSFKALPFVEDELVGIAKVMKGTVKLNPDFTAKAFLDGLETEAPVVHISSHFVFSPGSETDSFLLLGDGNPLSLQEIRNYEFNNVDLLTLSACETAVGGGQDANGQEVESFGVLAQEQRAKSVLATLWSVEDAGAAAFMQYFYRLHKQQKVTKVEAIRQTQIAMLQGELGGVNAEKRSGIYHNAEGKPVPQIVYIADPKAPYAHPYYWAPFILMGNWL